MATKTDFTEEEWETMQRGVSGAGMLVSLADRDFTDSFGEARALAKDLAEQHRDSSSTLVRDLARIHGTGFGLTTKPEELETGTLDSLRQAAATIATKAPDEVDAYRGLVLSVANRVAEAKGGVKDSETAAIEKITQALGSA
jgi:hypothetical protein